MQVIIKLFSTLSVIGNYDEIEKKTKEVGFGQHLNQDRGSYHTKLSLYYAQIVACIMPISQLVLYQDVTLLWQDLSSFYTKLSQYYAQITARIMPILQLVLYQDVTLLWQDLSSFYTKLSQYYICIDCGSYNAKIVGRNMPSYHSIMPRSQLVICQDGGSYAV